MNRKKFIKYIGFGFGGILVPVLSCNHEEIIDVTDKEAMQKRLQEYLEISNYGYYEKYKDIFYQERTIWVVEDYQFVNDESLKEQGIDYLIRLDVKYSVKCNFDIYKFTSTVKEEEVKKFRKCTVRKYSTSIEGQQFSVSQVPGERIQIPVIVEDWKNLKLKRGLPCIMTEDAFKKMISPESLSELTFLSHDN